MSRGFGYLQFESEAQLKNALSKGSVLILGRQCQLREQLTGSKRLHEPAPEVKSPKKEKPESNADFKSFLGL